MRHLWQEESNDGDGPILEEGYGVGDTAFYRTGDGFSVDLVIEITLDDATANMEYLDGWEWEHIGELHA